MFNEIQKTSNLDVMSYDKKDIKCKSVQIATLYVFEVGRELDWGLKGY